MTPDAQTLNAQTLVLVATIVPLVGLAVALVIWLVVVPLGLRGIFEALGVDRSRAWIPFVNIATVYRLGGYNEYWLIALVVPFANVVGAIILFLATHRINRRLGRSGWYTVLAVVAWWVWALALGLQRRIDRTAAAEPLVWSAQQRPQTSLTIPSEGDSSASGSVSGSVSASASLGGLGAPVTPGAWGPPAGPAVSPSPWPEETPVSAAGFIAPMPGQLMTDAEPALPSRDPQSFPELAPAPAPVVPAAPPASVVQPVPVAAPAPESLAPEPAPPAPRVEEQREAPRLETPPLQPQQYPPLAPIAPPAPEQRASPHVEEPLQPLQPQQYPPIAPPSPVPPIAPPSPSPVPPAPRVEEQREAPRLETPPPAPASVTPAPAAVAPPAPAPVATPAAPPSATPAPPTPYAPPEDDATIMTSGRADATVISSRRRPRWWVQTSMGARIELTGAAAIVGRRPSPHPLYPGAQLIAVTDDALSVSATHAVLEFVGGEWQVTDLDSTNGVWLLDAAGGETELGARNRARVTPKFMLGELGVQVVQGA